MIPVLWITQVYPRHPEDLFGGFLHRLARELPSRGFRPVVLAPGAQGVAARESIDGVDIVRFPAARACKAGLTYSGEMHRAALRSPLAFARLLRAFRTAAVELVEERQPRLLHAHWWFPGGWVAAPLATGARPLVLSLHGTDVRLLARMPPARPIARRVIGTAARLLPVSEYLSETIHELVPGGSSRIVLPMPADASCFRAGDSLAPREPLFVVAARLTSQKRVSLVIQAIARVAASADEAADRDVRLEVVGDGPERRRLQRLAAKLGVGNRVTFSGALPASRLAERFRAARAVVLCSEREGYGLTVVEAALCGAPGIGVRSGAIPELIEPERTGLLAEPGSAESLAGAIRRLAREPRLAADWGRAAANQAIDRTAPPLADRLRDVYQGVLAPPPRS